MTGRRFDRLTVVCRAKSRAGRTSVWLCHCDCGGNAIVLGANLRRGNTRSCGCLQRERTSHVNSTVMIGNANRRVHGHAIQSNRTREYETWLHMRRRVTELPRYIERGIHEPWLDFTVFLNDILKEAGPHPGKGWSIDRIDNDRGYYPGNVRWATMKTQNNNKSNSRKRK